MLNKKGELDIKNRLEELRDVYRKSEKKDSLRVLIFGNYGSGKTTILRTARKPVLLALFDQGGEKVLRPEIESGDVIVLDYSNESSSRPTEYKRWEKDLENFQKEGLFNHIGTYAIDSLTTWFDALSNQIIKEKKREGIFAIQDWQIAKNLVIEMMKFIGKLPCDFVMTSHLVHDKDEVTGEILSDINAFKSLRPLLPILFDEKWLAETKKSPNGSNYVIRLESSGRYKASSRLMGLSGGKIKATMPPNIKEILKLAGYNPEDKSTM